MGGACGVAPGRGPPLTLDDDLQHKSYNLPKSSFLGTSNTTSYTAHE